MKMHVVKYMEFLPKTIISETKHIAFNSTINFLKSS